MPTNKQRIEQVEKEIGDDFGKMPIMISQMLKSVILPQLKSVPDEAQEEMRGAVRHIVDVLKRVFDL